MNSTRNAIQSAFRLLRSEVRSKRLHTVQLTVEGNLLRIHLKSEARDLWIGYHEGQGYYLRTTNDDLPATYFSLTPTNVEEVFSFLLPAPSVPSDKLSDSRIEHITTSKNDD